MYQYRVDEDTTNKVVKMATKSSADEKIEKLIEELGNYDKMFDYSTKVDYEPVKYEKMADVVIDEGKIKEQAETELSDYKNTNITAIKDDTESKIAKLEKDKESYKENYDTAINSTKQYYAEVKEDASNDALKRGLSRSSIVINLMDAFDNAQLKKYDELNKEFTESINNIDSEISSLNVRQEQALNNFDITYAVKLQDKINTLTEELLAKQEKVLKYNNEIAEKEAEYNRKYAELEKELSETMWNREQDMMEYAGKYGVNMLSKYKQTQVYNIAQEYLDGMDTATAKQELTNNANLRELLGEENIAKLLARYS